MVNYVKVY